MLPTTNIPLVSETEKPQWPVEIDWTNPLARNLEFFILFDETHAPTDLVTGQTGVATGGPTKRASPDGPGVGCTTTQYYTFASRPSWNLTGDLTLAWRGIMDGISNYREFCCKTASTGATVNPFEFRTTNGSPYGFVLIRANTANRNWTSPGSIGTMTAGPFYAASVSQGSDISVGPTFYLNGTGGVSIASSGTGTGAPTADTSPMVVARRADGGVTYAGQISLIAGWSRQLTALEHRAIYTTPYQVLAPSAPVYSLVSTAVPPSFSAAWARQNTTVLGGGLGRA